MPKEPSDSRAAKQPVRVDVDAWRALLADNPAGADALAAFERGVQTAGAVPQAPARPSSPARRRRKRAELEAAAEPVLRPPAPARRRRRPRARRDAAAFKRELAARGARACSPYDLPDRAWKMCASIMYRRAVAEHVLAGLPREYKRAVRVAAYGQLTPAHLEATSGRDKRHATRGRKLRTLRNPRARECIALAWLVYSLGRDTRRRGFARVLDGVSRGVYAAVIPNPSTGEPYSVSHIFATSNGAARSGPNDCGAFVALHRAGALYKYQPDACDVPAALVGPSGYAFNVYLVSQVAAGVGAELVDELEPRGPP